MSRMQLLHTCLEKNVPFFSYRLPSAENYVVGIQSVSDVEAVSCFDALNLDCKGFVVAPFLFGSGESAFFLKEDFRVESDAVPEELLVYLASLPKGKVEEETWPSAITHDVYRERVEQLIESIRRGEAQKVVFSRNILSPLDESFDFVSVYGQLQKENPQAFVYCFYIPCHGLWMGATPELLLQKRASSVSTVALAGTMPQSSMTWSDKNREEQAVVVRYIEQVLQSQGVSCLKMEGPDSVVAGSMCHLQTRFRGELRQEGDVLSLLAALHPTPAVCGYPKAEAMRLIALHEHVGRSFYSGFIGPVCDGDFSFFVNLRCMKINANRAELFVGGGIMHDSEAEEEWQETMLKSKTMGRFVGLK